MQTQQQLESEYFRSLCKKGWKKQTEGKTKEEISAMMKARALAGMRKRNRTLALKQKAKRSSKKN